MFRYFAFFLLVAVSAEGASLNAGRIVGGREVSIAKHPHQVSIRRKTCEECTFLHICGGVIYNERTIITAAHCVYKREEKSFVVVAGSDTHSGSDGFIGLVEKFVVHEDYNAALTQNDIALMFLSTPLAFNDITIRSAPLTNVQPQGGTVAVVTGWGATSEGGPNSFKLQEVNVNIIDQSVCDKAYGYDRILENMLCAAVTGGGRDACQNDSGGPLMSGNQLVGIVSWGIGCARPEYPGVYANVAYFKNWIEKSVQEYSGE